MGRMLRVLRRPTSILLAILAAIVPAGAVAMASSVGPQKVVADIAAQENTNTNSNLDFLFAIYIITWAGFFVYIFIVSRRQRAMEREIADLRQLIAEQASPSTGLRTSAGKDS